MKRKGKEKRKLLIRVKKKDNKERWNIDETKLKKKKKKEKKKNGGKR